MRLQQSILFTTLLGLSNLLNLGGAWTTTTTTTRPVSRSVSATTTNLFRRHASLHAIYSTPYDMIRNEDEEKTNIVNTENSLQLPKSSTRRQWFHRVVGTAAATAIGLASIPSQAAFAAADLVSTAAVCDSAVSVWKKDGCIVYLLGTAHVSRESAALAGQLVRDTTPKGVFVELDPKRVSGTGVLAQKVGINNNGDGETVAVERQSRIIVPNIQAADMTSSISGSSSQQLIASGDTTTAALPPTAAVKKSDGNNNNNNNFLMKAASAAVGKSIKGMYKKLDSAGLESGEEFVVAITEGRKLGADIVLGDRDVEVTLRRVTEGLAKTDLKVLLSPDSELEQSLQELVPSNMQTKSDLTDEEFRSEFSSFVETMKAKDNVRKIMSQLQRVAPYLYEALVSERDAYMAAGLNGLSNELETIVAVVGIAHADGIEKNLQMNGWKAGNPSCSKFR
ncbi:TraB family protein [Nitzschia inconspicua]|uniref:TraB family protein n=1 Tax=Nitzschia inconspicua TaxID=303405 RepID=A0A9K3L3W0_9STRA|nr:TraB family protein [Nitzschia inconspicua]